MMMNRSNRKRTLVIPGIILWILASCGPEVTDTRVPLAIRSGPFEVLVPAHGQLKAVQSTPIRVPTQSRGRLTLAWLAPMETPVRAGDPLLRFDGYAMRQELDKVELEIAKSDLRIELKQRELKDQQTKHQWDLDILAMELEQALRFAPGEEKIFSTNQRIDFERDLDLLEEKKNYYEEELRRMQLAGTTELQALQLRRESHVLKKNQILEAMDALEVVAPHDGVFFPSQESRSVPHLGMTVWPGMPLCELPDMSQMEAKVHVLESEALGLKPGLCAEVQVMSRPERSIDATIKTVDAMAKPLDRENPLKYFEVILSLAVTDPTFMKPGTRVRAQIHVHQQQDVISVPNQVIVQKDGQSGVESLRAGSWVFTPVTLGDRSLTRTVILEGLSQGDAVALNPRSPDS